MILIIFGLVWLYLFYKSKKQETRKPWVFVLIIVGVVFGSSYISLPEKAFSVSPLFIFIFCLLIIGPIEFRTNIFNCFGLKRSLIYGLILGFIFSAFLIILRNNFQSLSFPTVKKIIFVLQNTLAEEILFRGFLISYLLNQRIKPVYSNFIQTICFMSGHTYWFTDSNGWLYVILSGVFALTAGYLVLRDKNVSGTIIMHLLVNVTSIL